MQERLFSDFDLGETLRSNREKAREEVDIISESQFLNNDDEVLFEHVLSKMVVTHLELHEDLKEMQPQESQVDVRGDFRRGTQNENRPCMVPGLRITISIPFTGDAILWKCRPSTYTSCVPHAQIETDRNDNNKGNVIIILNKPSDTLGDGQAIKSEINKIVDDIKKWLGYIRTDIEAHNRSLEGVIRKAVSARRGRLGVHSKVLDVLEIPLKKNPGVPDIKPLPTRKKIVKPLESKPNVPPEPGILKEVYEDILSIIRHEGRTFEATPKTFAVHDEEGLRDIILAHLNGHYKGAATGETFRKSGKTDIRIEDKSRAAFVAECKLWKGKSVLLDAIDQILGYLVWRDCKTSLVVFNKDVAGFAKIQGNLPAIMKNHSNFVKEEFLQEHGEWRYIFKSKDDEDRRIAVHVFLFNLYIGK